MAIKVKPSTPRSAAADAVASDAWQDAPTEFTRRNVTMHVYGDTGTGRTRLALTAPGPIALAHTAEKVDGLVQQFAKEKKIRMINFGGTFAGSPQDICDQAAPLWSRMAKAWYDAVDNWAKTAIMDTHTEGWEILRLARFGELNPRGRTDSLYGPVNAEWRSVMKRGRTRDHCNVILIGQTKDEYREVRKANGTSSERTGNTIVAGQKEVGIIADVIVRTSKSFIGKGGNTVFTATIEKGWFNGHSEGTTLENDDITFANIMSLVTETDASEWE